MARHTLLQSEVLVEHYRRFALPNSFDVGDQGDAVGAALALIFEATKHPLADIDAEGARIALACWASEPVLRRYRE